MVATPRAGQGLSARAAAIVETGETPRNIANKVVLLLRNHDLAGAKSVDGRRLILEDYSWTKVIERLLKRLETLWRDSSRNARIDVQHPNFEGFDWNWNCFSTARCQNVSQDVIDAADECL
jgi:hypothetical protein